MMLFRFCPAGVWSVSFYAVAGCACFVARLCKVCRQDAYVLQLVCRWCVGGCLEAFLLYINRVCVSLLRPIACQSVVRQMWYRRALVVCFCGCMSVFCGYCIVFRDYLVAIIKYMDIIMLFDYAL